MTYSSISHWDLTEWTDKLENIARDKFLPLIMSAGANKVQMVRTGDLSLCVVTEYPDAKTAAAAQKHIADVRAKATDELPMKMASTCAGAVFAHS